MSVFQVQLTQPGVSPISGQGNMDEHALGKYGAADASLQTPIPHSIQRTAYVMGPNKINRKLTDGETFTDSNYWKIYCAAPVGPLAPDQAIVSLVTDDGSVYDYNNPAVNVYPKVYNISVPSSSTFASNDALGNVADILSDTGSYAVYCQLSLNSGDVKVQINGDSGAIFDLTSTQVQIFNPGDMAITKLEFQYVSGSSCVVQVLLSIVSQSMS